MGKAARRRRAARPPAPPGRAARGHDHARDPRQEASAALTRLVRGNPPGNMSLAGAYALGYGALGVAQHDGDAPDWFDQLDPLDTLFLGTVWPYRLHDGYEFGNARTAWLRLMRTTPHWPGVERFVTEVVQASETHELPVDAGELMLLVAGRLEAAGLDRRKLPAALLPGSALAQARFVTGPDPDQPLPDPPADAADVVARLWAAIAVDVDLPHDGSPADALREGLHLLGRAGLDVRAEPAVLLPALYLALVAAEDEMIQEAAERAEAWALGLAEDSPLVAVVDVLLLAPQRGLDTDTTLAHLYGLPAFTQPVLAADRRFTSTPGRALVDLAFELGFRQVDTRDAKVVRLDPDAGVMLAEQARAFEARFGRPPGPHDPLFFDPHADTPQPMPVAGIEAATTAMLHAAGVCGAWIYAYQHTDGLLPRPDGGFTTDADARDWHAAADRYLRTHPGETVDEHVELGKLRAMLAMVSLDMAARHPQFGASLANSLHAGDASPDSDAGVVAQFLTASAAPIMASLRDPAAAAAATELARAWCGPAMAQRIHDAATAEDPTAVDSDVLLAVAVAQLTAAG
jgi:hypothetical protein